MTMDEITARKSEIETEIRSEGITEERLDALQVEVETLEAEERTIVEAAEERKAEVEAVVNAPAAEIVETAEEVKNITEERIMDNSTVEYRNAFAAYLSGRANEEQRSILADNTSYGDGVSLPVALDKQIWDQVAENHPILGDIDRYATGTELKVTKMTPAAISKKKDSDENSEETYTTAEVTLYGADYNTSIKLSYAEAKMSQGAMEKYLVDSLSRIIGDAIAKDVFARILSDAGTAQKVNITSDLFADVKAALALAKKASKPVVYAPAEKYYDIVGAINANGGNPYNMGAVLGCEVKLDNAATSITVVDPSCFVLNVIQDTTVESQKDVADAKIVIGGYCRAEGTLRVTTAAAYIA